MPYTFSDIPCFIVMLLSPPPFGFRLVVHLGVFALNSGQLCWQFVPCVTRRTFSRHSAFQQEFRDRVGPYWGVTREVADSLTALERARSLRCVHTAFSNKPVNQAFTPFPPGGPSPCPGHYSPAFGYYAASALRPTGWHFRPPPRDG